MPTWAPLVWFAALAAVLTFVVVALVRPPGPLDQPDLAYQRDGLLLDGPTVDDEVAGIEFGDRPVALLFLRKPPDPSALAEWAASVPDVADTYVVLPRPTATDLPLPDVVDPGSRLAAAVGMPEPVDGGPPVGYAVVDSDRVVSVRTAGPAVPGQRLRGRNDGQCRDVNGCTCPAASHRCVQHAVVAARGADHRGVGLSSARLWGS